MTFHSIENLQNQIEQTTIRNTKRVEHPIKAVSEFLTEQEFGKNILLRQLKAGLIYPAYFQHVTGEKPPDELS